MSEDGGKGSWQRVPPDPRLLNMLVSHLLGPTFWNWTITCKPDPATFTLWIQRTQSSGWECYGDIELAPLSKPRSPDEGSDIMTL